jgi:hypothetical protein
MSRTAQLYYRIIAQNPTAAALDAARALLDAEQVSYRIETNDVETNVYIFEDKTLMHDGLEREVKLLLK